MAKMPKERLEKYRALDKEALNYVNERMTRFISRASKAGVTFDTAGYYPQSGFFQAPHKQDLSDVDISIVGSPLDLGVIGCVGTRHGPEGIREMSHRTGGMMHERSAEVPLEMCNIIDYGDVSWSATHLAARLDDIACVFETLGKAGVSTLNCGGEHTTSYGVLKGLSKAYEDEAFSLIHIDAHCDTMASWGGDVVNDGSVFRQAVLQGFIDPEKTVQIGMHGRCDFLWDFSRATDMLIITADEVFENGVSYVMDKIRERIGVQDKTYFSFDVDGLCSTEMMATAGPEPFGLTPRQVRDIIYRSREFNIIGADMVEFNPNRDPNQGDTMLATGLFWELCSMLSHVRHRNNGGIDNPTIWT